MHHRGAVRSSRRHGSTVVGGHRAYSTRCNAKKPGKAVAASAPAAFRGGAQPQQQQQQQQQQRRRPVGLPPAAAPMGGPSRPRDVLGHAPGPVLPDFESTLKVGETPVLDLSHLSRNPAVKILAKCEFANPTGSIKDRMVQFVLEQAEAEGKLPAGGTIVAATSGNTGASVAMLAAMNGYDYKVITNAKCSAEKVNIMSAFGGEVVVGPSGVPADHPDHYQNMAISMCDADPSFYDLDQYSNPLNPESYYHTLGPEIWANTDGHVTHFVAGGSTGGTMSGTGRYLKDQNPEVECVMADPEGSVFYDYFKNKVPEEELIAGSYLVEGVGKDSIPGAMDFGVVDGILQVADADAFETCLTVAKTTGVLIGGSSGLNVHGAAVLSGKIEEGVIVTVLPDSGFKYLSKIYNSEWRNKKLNVTAR